MRYLEQHSIVGLTAIRLNTALIFTFTATSEGLFVLLKGYLYLLGITIRVLHSFLAQYFEQSIVYNLSFLVEIPLWQSYKHRKPINEVISIVWCQLCLFIPLLSVLEALLDGSTVGTTRELLSLLWDARGLSHECGVWYKCNAQRCTLSSPRVLTVVSKLPIH